MKEIPLTQGKVAIVDDDDYECVSSLKWFAHKRKKGTGWYARTNIRDKDGKRRTLLMHRLIMGWDHLFIDHKNVDGLDNQRHNLRWATRAGNAANTKVRADSVSGIKGVRWDERASRWAAQITVQGKQLWLGYHDTVEDAHAAYVEAAKKHHGEFARVA